MVYSIHLLCRDHTTARCDPITAAFMNSIRGHSFRDTMDHAQFYKHTLATPISNALIINVDHIEMSNLELGQCDHAIGGIATVAH